MADQRNANTPVTAKDSAGLKPRKTAAIQQVNRNCCHLALTLKDLQDLSHFGGAANHFQAVARIYIITEIQNDSIPPDQGMLQLLSSQSTNAIGRMHREMINHINMKPHTSKAVSVHKATRSKHLLMTRTEKYDRKVMKEIRMRVDAASEREREQKRLGKKR